MAVGLVTTFKGLGAQQRAGARPEMIAGGRRRAHRTLH
jgi:hypothetical protein